MLGGVLQMPDDKFPKPTRMTASIKLADPAHERATAPVDARERWRPQAAAGLSPTLDAKDQDRRDPTDLEHLEGRDRRRAGRIPRPQPRRHATARCALCGRSPPPEA